MKRQNLIAVFAATTCTSFFFLTPHLYPAHAQEASQNNTTPSYTVQDGDSLSTIAQAKLGDMNKWNDIFTLNQAVISNPDDIYPGETLQLPQAAPVTTADLTSSGNTIPQLRTVSQSIGSAPIPTPVVMYSPKPRLYNTIPTPMATTQPSGNTAYSDMINAAAAQYGVSSGLMNKIISCESGYNPNAYNPSGATGIAQFMPGTFNGSWNPYRSEGIHSAHGQIYAMALKLSQGGAGAWVCSKM